MTICHDNRFVICVNFCFLLVFRIFRHNPGSVLYAKCNTDSTRISFKFYAGTICNVCAHVMLFLSCALASVCMLPLIWHVDIDKLHGAATELESCACILYMMFSFAAVVVQPTQASSSW